MESIKQVYNGSADFGKNICFTICGNGDLIYKMYLVITISESIDLDNHKWVDNLGYALLEEIEIGGQQIDKHYGEWLDIYSELTLSKKKKDCILKMIHNSVVNSRIPKFKMYIPLNFWFCKNVGLALPLIALQYHEVKIKIKLSNLSKLQENVTGLTTIPKILNCSLYVDYIYLDTYERRQFAKVSHEYLIEQLQFTGMEDLDNKHIIHFNHPVKEIIWTTKLNDNILNNKYFNYTSKSVLDTGTFASYENSLDFTEIGTKTIENDFIIIKDTILSSFSINLILTVNITPHITNYNNPYVIHYVNNNLFLTISQGMGLNSVVIDVENVANTLELIRTFTLIAINGNNGNGNIDGLYWGDINQSNDFFNILFKFFQIIFQILPLILTNYLRHKGHFLKFFSLSYLYCLLFSHLFHSLLYFIIKG
jgi:hypothetical protein